MMDPHFDAYLQGLIRMLPVPRRQRQSIVRELSDHMLYRYQRLIEQGWTPTAARAEVLADLGDAAELAEMFVRLADRQRWRRQMALSVLSVAAAVVLVWLAPRLYGPLGPMPGRDGGSGEAGHRSLEVARQAAGPLMAREAPMRTGRTFAGTGAGLLTGLMAAMSTAQSAVPTTMNHQGVVTVSGQRFTGTGQFKFAIVGAGGVNRWTHDGSRVGQGNVAPDTALNLPVTDGVYSVLLGAASLGMTAIPADVFDDQSLSLRIWFSDNVNGFQQLVPDPQLASSPYAFRAATVDDGAITTVKLADQSVTADKLASDVGVWSMSPDGLSYANGKVGIGLPEPTAKLDVYADDGVIFNAAGPLIASDPSIWTELTHTPDWGSRGGFGALGYDGKLWVIGGSSAVVKNDVWWSVDGVSWIRATAAANWTARSYHACLVFDNKMWILGGSGSGNRNDVWYSSDGINWTQATAAAPWAARWQHTASVHDGKMWVMGGTDGASPTFNDVWYSTNGSQWTRATAAAPWVGRAYPVSMSFGGKLWIMAGYVGSTGQRLHDVWSSVDGTTWTQATAAASWTERLGAGGVSHGGKMWLMGGENGGTQFNDIWTSTDGASWTLAAASSSWTPRVCLPGPVLHHGRMWLVSSNEVWRMDGVGGQAIVKLTESGTLGVGTDSPDESYVVDANGGIKCQYLIQVSTREAKKDLQPMTELEHKGVLDRVMRAPVVRFRYRNESPYAPLRTGVIAEESPAELLSADGKGVDLGQMTACLLAAFQADRQEMLDRLAEQQRQIEALQREIADLKTGP